MARYLARDTFLEIGDGASEETFARVAQVISYDGPNMTSEFAEFDDHDVPAGYIEKLKTKKDPGQLSFTVHYDPADPTHIALEDEFETMDAAANWRFTLPTAAHARKTKSFRAFVSELGPITAASDGKLERSMTLELTGQPDHAAG